MAERIKKAPRRVTMSVRMDVPTRQLIERAAALIRKSRSAFILDAACDEARSTLQDHRTFTVSKKRLDHMRKALNRLKARERRRGKHSGSVLPRVKPLR